MKTIPRALAAIFGGAILGSIFAVPVGLFIDLLTGHNATSDPWGMTLPNATYAIATGFLMGFFAGLIFRQNGKLIGALAQVVPSSIIFSFLVLLNLRNHRVNADTANQSMLLAVGVFPAVLGGAYGVRFPTRSLAQVLNFAGFALFIVFAFWGFALSLGIVNRVASFWGVVVGLTVAPVTLAAAPCYALVAWGSWSLLLISYGGIILSALVWWLASIVNPSSALFAQRG